MLSFVLVSILQASLIPPFLGVGVSVSEWAFGFHLMYLEFVLCVLGIFNQELFAFFLVVCFISDLIPAVFLSF